MFRSILLISIAMTSILPAHAGSNRLTVSPFTATLSVQDPEIHLREARIITQNIFCSRVGPCAGGPVEETSSKLHFLFNISTAVAEASLTTPEVLESSLWFHRFQACRVILQVYGETETRRLAGEFNLVWKNGSEICNSSSAVRELILRELVAPLRVSREGTSGLRIER